MQRTIVESIRTPLMTRRQLLGASALSIGGWLLPKPDDAKAGDGNAVAPFRDYAEVLSRIENRGHQIRTLGFAPDRSPVVAVRTGGRKQPAIFISAGSHATEHAGVAAAVELIDRLKTKHEAWVIPTRDPIGLNGFRYALSLGIGSKPPIDTLEAAETLLRKEGQVLLDNNDKLLVLIGECGYASRGLYGSVKKGEAYLEPLLGRRIYFPSRSSDMPGSGPLERAYTLVVTPDGEVLHLNRFHDTSWAPAEVACTRRLMAEIQPGLTFDLHEYGGDSLWMSARRQRTDDDERWELRMAEEAIRNIAASGGKLAPEDYSPGAFFEKRERGLYWLDAGQRGEGLNLVDFAARKYGPGFTIETGMRGAFEERVRQHVTIVQTAVNIFEERYPG